MPLFSIPLSGLNASSDALSVIANNLSNLNTVGFKDSQATFKDLFYESVGSNGAGNPMQIGAGVGVAGVTTDFTTGSLDATGVSTDVAISGDGFFVTDKDGARQYTRAGNFTVTSGGQLVTQDGQSVLGYGATNGVLSQNQVLGSIFLDKGQISPPASTNDVQLHTNLNSAANVGDSYSSPMTVYDSLGQSHVVTFAFTKTAANAWSYSMSLPAADTGGTGAPTVIKTGSLTFDGNGKLTSPTTDVTGIGVTGFADGASNLTFTWQLLDPNTKVPMVTQVSSASSTASTFQDGYASGTLVSFAVNSDGVIEGSFTNGKSMAVGQLALANFANTNGLMRTGDNTYTSTLASGAPVTGAPGTGGRGTLTGGALELSNVDIAQEFSKMIVAQRGFQANAKVVTTFDEVTQDTINLKR